MSSFDWSDGYTAGQEDTAAQAHQVAKDMRKWMEDHRWIKELEGWATSLESL